MCLEQIYTSLDALSTGSLARSYAFRGGLTVYGITPLVGKPRPRVGGALSRYVLM
jgi:hypothetical protein